MTTVDLAAATEAPSGPPSICPEASERHQPVPGWPDAVAEAAVVAANRARFESLLVTAERAAVAGEWSTAAAWAQVAAHSAWFGYAGLGASPRLEALLVRIAVAALGVEADAPSRPSGALAEGRPRTVLYVFTEAYDIGGHTRQAYRMLTRDEAHPVVVLTQQQAPVPNALRAAVAAKGGVVHRVPGGADGLLERARIVRRLARAADAVAVYAHPYDVVPTLALCGGDTPPVLTVNHADCSFWVGLAATEVVSEHREAGMRFTQACRGVGPGHSTLLPLPVDPLEPTAPAPELRDALGIPRDAVVATSVASGYKTQPLIFPGLLDVLLSAVERIPDLHVVAVGPQPDGAWADATSRTGGRLRTVGPQVDPTPWFAAADLYIDTTPVGSGTSILEAAISGIPTISLLPFQHHGELMGSNSPGQASGHTVTRHGEAFVAELGRLVAEPDRRRSLGAQARAAVLAHHTGDAWEAALRRAYRLAATAPRIRAADLAPEPPPEDFNRILVGFCRNAGFDVPLERLMVMHPDVVADLGPPALVPTELGRAVEAAAASGGPSLAERADASLRIEAPAAPGPVAAGAPLAESDDARPPAGGCRYTAVAPPGWADEPGELAATLSECFDAPVAVRPHRLVLPLPDAAGPADVQRALVVADRVIRDLGADPADLPFEVAVGDDPPEVRLAGPRLVLATDGSARRGMALMARWLRRHAG